MSSFQPDSESNINLEVVLGIAQQAGDLVLAMQLQGLQKINSKSSTSDLVTEADLASEKFIRAELLRHYPTFDFWGEESNEPPSSEYFWIVDPIDGTNNFANGLPYFAVNIALNRGDITLIGVTLELPARQLYFAQVDQGAYQRTPDGRNLQLHVNQTPALDHAFISTGFPYHRREHNDNNLAEFTYFLTKTQGIRCMGAAAMDLANVASGALAGYWEGWLHPWDAAPGVLLVREAGGQVTDYWGMPWQLTSKTLIASNGKQKLHEELVAGIREARQKLTSPLLP